MYSHQALGSLGGGGSHYRNFVLDIHVSTLACCNLAAHAQILDRGLTAKCAMQSRTSSPAAAKTRCLRGFGGLDCRPAAVGRGAGGTTGIGIGIGMESPDRRLSRMKPTLTNTLAMSHHY